MQYDAQELSQDQIQQVQRRLNQKGFDAGAVDGKWNNRTQSALRNFQEAQGMKQTGNLDQKTVSSLGVDFGSQDSGQTVGAAPDRAGSSEQQRDTDKGRPEVSWKTPAGAGAVTSWGCVRTGMAARLSSS